mmetsp:Transcript_51403/g.134223  ORF Transcript_51403/g.134223 Transcript_51403/m.134223 type:complete len:199 (+) Transcript_51403:1014-1610(+)
MVHVVVPIRMAVRNLVMSFSSNLKGLSGPSSSAIFFTFQGHNVVIAVSAPARHAEIIKRTAHNTILQTGGVSPVVCCPCDAILTMCAPLCLGTTVINSHPINVTNVTLVVGGDGTILFGYLVLETCGSFVRWIISDEGNTQLMSFRSFGISQHFPPVFLREELANKSGEGLRQGVVGPENGICRAFRGKKQEGALHQQ